ncbi:MAG TPA: hypothetical protein V6C71_00690 [Coleofasciculaceae cyanobacterium]
MIQSLRGRIARQSITDTPSDIVEDDDLSEALRGNPQDRPCMISSLRRVRCIASNPISLTSCKTVFLAASSSPQTNMTVAFPS